MSQEFKKSQPTPGDVHVNILRLPTSASTFCKMLRILLQVECFPTSHRASGPTYTTLTIAGYFNRDEMAKRAPGTESQGSGFTVATDNYFCDVWAFHHDIPDQRRANADAALAPDREAAELLMRKALIRKEKDWATTNFTTSVWTTDLTGVAGAPAGGQFQQWDQASSTPLEDVAAGMDTVLESTGFMPNTLVLSQQGWTRFEEPPGHR